MQVEDVVVAVNDTKVTGERQFRSLVAELPPDEEARLRVVRDRAALDVKVRLGLQPENISAPVRDLRLRGRAVGRLGMFVRTMRAGMLRTFDEQTRGVVVFGLDDRWDAAPDIKPLEVLVACNDKPVKSVFDLNAVLKDVPANENVRLEVLEPTGDRRIISVKPRGKE